MSTDLFLALLDKDNRRGHPLLAALLYAFCPLAAHWWQAGVQPEVPYDLLWPRPGSGPHAAGSLDGLRFRIFAG